MSKCEHKLCRMWHSGFDPWAVALWWCPRCGGLDARIPDEPEQPETGTLAMARPATWWVKVNERAGIRFGHARELSREQVREFTTALHRANDVSETMMMRMAGKDPTWQLEPRDDDLVVVSRWRGIDWKFGLTLLPIVPRKEVGCDGCRTLIKAGERAWRGSQAPKGLSTENGATGYRFCMPCINRMSPTPMGKTRGQGAVLKLVKGGDNEGES